MVQVSSCIIIVLAPSPNFESTAVGTFDFGSQASGPLKVGNHLRMGGNLEKSKIKK
jgi:hypothetical protein